MNILEKDLEEIISSTSTEKLWDKGIYLQGKCYRQPKLGNYGIADLIYVSKDYEIKETCDSIKTVPYLNIQVCELKKDKAGISAFFQAVRYAKGVSRYLELRSCENYRIEIILIAPKIDTSSDYIFITDLLSSDKLRCISRVSNYSVNYGFDGITFKKEQGYSITDENFKTIK